MPTLPPVIPPSAGFRRWFFRPVRLAECRGRWQFIYRLLTQQYAVKIALTIPIALLISEPTSEAQLELFRNPFLAFITVVVTAPVLETLLLQSVPIELVRAWGHSRRAQFLFGAVPFALLHFAGGIASGVAAGIVGGLFFSHAYLECRSQSWWTSVEVTAVIHALHNLIILPLAIAAAQ